MARKKRKVVKVIPKLTGNVAEDLRMFEEQASLLSNKARNTYDDIYPLVKQFRKSITDKVTVNYVFWNVVKWFMETNYVRKHILNEILCKFTPYEFYVYHLYKGDELIYVGKTDRLNDRTTWHKKDGKDFDNIKLYACKNTKEQDVLENTCIYKLSPTLNKSVRLNMVDKDLIIPEFIDTSEIKPNYVGTNGIKERISLDAEYHYLYGVGFIHHRVVPKPYWK